MWNDPSQPHGLVCLPCVIERKQAEQASTPQAELPKMRPAITLLQGAVPHCYEHIAIQHQSPLMVPGRPG
ncbi:hypothetical protein [Streptacidiphilus sp. EB103A]|uniref:hypothetical protein n=1 Tax=Streptacidiphilus sp. EB103A TaxID=3156275 RepID=UPI003518C330